MTQQIITAQSCYLDGYDLTSRSNALAIEYAAEAKDGTTLGQTSRVRQGGLKTVLAAISGFMEPDATDAFKFSNMGVKDKPLSFGLTADTHGAVAMTLLATEAELKLGAQVGELLPFDMSAQSSDRLVRGNILLTSKAVALTASGNGTGLQLGAVASGKKIYAAMHVLNAGTGSFTAKLQSDDNSGFASATDRITFSAATGIGSQWSSAAGAITDDWWRINYTISGGAPSFKVVIVVGII